MKTMSRSRDPDHDRPRASLHTEYGVLQLTIFDNDRIGVSTLRPDGFITVNRVQLNVSGRLLRAEDGIWQWENSNHITVSRHDGRDSGPGLRGVSWNAYDKVRDAIPVAVTQWVNGHPELLQAGAIAARSERIRELQVELDQTVKRAGTVGAQIEHLRDEIAVLQQDPQ
jgi:hypothetical protein